jgi:GDP-6-deoxy-D-talose 4-dehydrogenase
VGFHSKILVTGPEGFTGRHLIRFLSNKGYEVFNLMSNLLDANNLDAEILSVNPEYVIHLGGISFAGYENNKNIYNVNTIGSINLLESCKKLRGLSRVILASSAAVYGNQVSSVLDESQCPRPTSHYGCSKLNMELLSQNYIKYFPMTIVRPFNYTGVGHDKVFVIPKIVNAFKERVAEVSLGNINVYREFNDVRDVCAIYEKLLTSRSKFDLVNICSGKAICLRDIISTLEVACGHSPKIKIDEKFLRTNDTKSLAGSPARLLKLTGYEFKYSIVDTLNWMLKEE